MIPFAEFQKLDLRVAKVLSVENHPNADKLYVLKIDLGGTERQIVAGLRPYYTPEQLQGTIDRRRGEPRAGRAARSGEPGHAAGGAGRAEGAGAPAGRRGGARFSRSS